MIRALRKWYWTYLFYMEIERERELERVYQAEKEKIRRMKRLANRKLGILAEEEEQHATT